MLKAVKIRLYPNKTQEIYINKLLGCYRFVYNQCLALKKQKYDENKTSLNLKELGDYFHNDLTKNQEYSFLNEHNTKVLKQSIINLLDAYKLFFQKNGTGFPKFKSRKDNKQSCRFPVEAISKCNDYSTGKLTLTTDLKNIKFRCSNECKNYLVKHKSNIKSATLTKTKSGKYFLSVLVDGDLNKDLPKTNNMVGIDLGIKTFVTTSNNETFENLRLKRTNEKILARLQRYVSRKQKGSRNRNKARIRLAKYYEYLNNVKENYLHEVTNKLLSENQTIIMETLNVSGMMKNHKLARSIQELSLYRFKSILEYKSVWCGRELIFIYQFYPSSKMCNVCKTKNESLSLSDRTWRCQCVAEHDRDHNASLNILNEGKRIMAGKTTSIGCRTSESTLTERSPIGHSMK